MTHKEYYDQYLIDKAVSDYSMEDFKELILLLAEHQIGMDITLNFKSRDNEYYMVVYDNPFEVSFGRCSSYHDCDEQYFPSLEDLFSAELVDGISLKEEWADLEWIGTEPPMDQFTADEIIEDYEKARKNNPYWKDR